VSLAKQGVGLSMVPAKLREDGQVPQCIADGLAFGPVLAQLLLGFIETGQMNEGDAPPQGEVGIVRSQTRHLVVDRERFVRRIVARLTRRHEAAEPNPWKMGDSEPEFIDGMLRNIVGIEIAVTSLAGKRKLSQNKEARDRLGAADTLAARGIDELAKSMRTAG